MKNIIFIFAISGIILSPSAVLAIGQNTQPINITNALRGESYTKNTTVYNTEKTAIKADLVAKGQIRDWVKFFPENDPKNPTSTIYMAPGEKRKLKAVFSVPKNAGNGDYSGQIAIVKKVEKKSDGRNPLANVDQSVDRPIKIRVTDKEETKFTVQVIPNKYDLKSQENLIIRVIYDNQGNTTIRPQANVRVADADNQTAYSVIYPYQENMDPVRPLSIFEAPAITVPTATFTQGRYKVYMDFSQNSVGQAKKEFGFSVGLVDESQGAVLGSKIERSPEDIINLALLFTAVFIFFAAFFYTRYLKLKKTHS